VKAVLIVPKRREITLGALLEGTLVMVVMMMMMMMRMMMMMK
jgi:hypothetical protein